MSIVETKRSDFNFPANSRGTAEESPGRLELRVDPKLSAPMYEQIKSCIREQILSGRLHSGQRIPSARKISQQIGVSYVTVTRGLNALVNEGVLESRIPGGTYVTRRRGNRLQTIGIIGCRPYKQIYEHSRYYSRLVSLLLENVVEHDRTVVYNYWPDDVKLCNLFNDMTLVDGVILLYMNPGEKRFDQLQQVQRIGIPILCLGRTFRRDILTVDSENISDTSRAVRHLLSMGHRRIALLGVVFDTEQDHGLPHSLRLEGYRQAMEQFGPGFDPSLVVLGRPQEQAEHLLALADPPTAALNIAYANQIPQLMDHLHGTPLEAGKGLYLCAYDEDIWNSIGPRGIDYMRIEQSLEAIAAEGVECIARMLDDRNYQPSSKRLASRIVRITADGRQDVLD